MSDKQAVRAGKGGANLTTHSSGTVAVTPSPIATASDKATPRASRNPASSTAPVTVRDENRPEKSAQRQPEVILSPLPTFAAERSRKRVK